ncbi:hypothetical protein GCM10007216_30110 [Thalassobacillus devorans]|uniref:Uncharacterized protein n=1 Tax=Thalassobacillus devorans TaxID=279813 RepID=A0ABQ1PHF0_9BACI|nr:hypothetical protein GCM10007216_30110 [Thalassobacillus devorans]
MAKERGKRDKIKSFSKAFGNEIREYFIIGLIWKGLTFLPRLLIRLFN